MMNSKEQSHLQSTIQVLNAGFKNAKEKGFGLKNVQYFSEICSGICMRKRRPCPLFWQFQMSYQLSKNAFKKVGNA